MLGSIVGSAGGTAAMRGAMNLERIYTHHPLSAATILARLERQGITGAETTITEWHLAVDGESGITDQNHNGGVQSVLELGIAAEVSPATRVVDIGAGLGGSARVLAVAFGCSVVAVDADPQRHRDCEALTRLVALENRVSAIQHDARTGPADLSDAHVLWGQSAWIHFDDGPAFLDAWIPTLRRGGRVVLADAFLKRPPRSDAESNLILDLEESWGAHLVRLDDWLVPLERAGFAVTYRQDYTDDALLEFDRLARQSESWPSGTRTDYEATAWARAVASLQSGLIEGVRIVAHRR